MDIVWVGFAFVVGLLVSRIHIPPLVGYLLAGLLLAIFDYEPGPLMAEIAHLGVIFLLFTVGLHIRLKNVLQKEVTGVGLVHLTISTVIFFPICSIFGHGFESAWVISIILGFSSTVLAAKNLETRGELGAYYGRLAIGILIIQDLVAIGIIAFASGSTPSPWAFTLLGLPLLRPLISRLLSLVERDELLLLMALSLAIGGDELFRLFNLSGELGALALGMLLTSDEKGEELGKKIWSLKEAFLVGFFLQIGLIGFPGNSNDYLFIGVMLAMLPLKMLLFFVLFMGFSLRARTGYQATLSLTAYSEFTLIAGAVAASAGIIPSGFMVVLGLLTGVSFTINAILVRHEDGLWERVDHFLKRFERKKKHPDHRAGSFGAAEYLVVGMGTTGRSAYQVLKESGRRVVGMDIDQELVGRLLKEDWRVLSGDAQDIGMWEQIDMRALKAVILAMSGGIELKRHALRTLAKCTWEVPIYVLTLNEREEAIIKEEGGIPIAVPSREMGKKLAEMSMSHS